MNKEKFRKKLPTIIYLVSIIVSGAYCYFGISAVQSNFEVLIIGGITMIIIYLAGIEYHLNQQE